MPRSFLAQLRAVRAPLTQRRGCSHPPAHRLHIAMAAVLLWFPERRRVRRIIVSAGLIVVCGFLSGLALGRPPVSPALAQDSGVTRCVEVVPHYYAIDAADARLLCPGIVEAMRDARDDEALDRTNSCDLFLALGMDDSDETARQACMAVFVVVMDPTGRGPQAFAAPKPPAAIPGVAPKPVSAASSGGSAWLDQAIRDYQVSRRDGGIAYTAADLARFYQCLTTQSANGREAALAACDSG